MSRLPTLPVVVHCPVTDNLYKRVTQMHPLSVEARDRLRTENFSVLAELAMCPADRAVQIFGKEAADEIQRTLDEYGYNFGSLPNIEPFLLRLSSFNLGDDVVREIQGNFSVANPSAIAIAFRGMLDVIPLTRAQLNRAMHRLTGLESQLRLPQVFVPCLSEQEVLFYRAPIGALTLPKHVEDHIVGPCKLRMVYELHWAANTHGFPFHDEVATAFASLGQALGRELQWGHFEQIYDNT